MGYAGWLTRLSADFRVMVAQDEWRPYRFMCVYGIHLGGYIGGLLAMVVAIVHIVRQRRRLAGVARLWRAIHARGSDELFR